MDDRKSVEVVDLAITSPEMLEAGAREALIGDPNYPRRQIARDVFFAMLKVALQSADMRCVYSALFSESDGQALDNLPLEQLSIQGKCVS